MGRGSGEGVEYRDREIYTVFPQHLNWIGCNNALTIKYQNGKYSLSTTPTQCGEEREEGRERWRRKGGGGCSDYHLINGGGWNMQSLRNKRGSETKLGTKDAAETAWCTLSCGGEAPSCHDMTTWHVWTYENAIVSNNVMSEQTSSSNWKLMGIIFFFVLIITIIQVLNWSFMWF